MRHKIYRLWTGLGTILLANLSSLENVEKAKDILRPLVIYPVAPYHLLSEEDFCVTEREIEDEELEEYKVDILEFTNDDGTRIIIHLNDEKGG